MKINELRLDNIVNVKGSKEPRGVTVEDFKLAIDGENPYLTPILLNEDWLLKFGFVNSDYDETKYNPDNEFSDQFKYILESGVFHRPLTCKPHDGWIVRLGDYESKVEIKFVHQLQNLYFSLTGKELTIKN